MKKGFTLIELIVVMAVISFLLIVSIPIALNAVKRAKSTQVGRNLVSIIKAGEMFYYNEKPEDVSVISIDFLKEKNYLEDSLKENDITKYNIEAINLENKLILRSSYTGGDISTELVLKIFPFLKSSGNILYMEVNLAK